jgi:hypothetical protein
MAAISGSDREKRARRGVPRVVKKAPKEHVHLLPPVFPVPGGGEPVDDQGDKGVEGEVTHEVEENVVLVVEDEAVGRAGEGQRGPPRRGASIRLFLHWDGIVRRPDERFERGCGPFPPAARIQGYRHGYLASAWMEIRRSATAWQHCPVGKIILPDATSNGIRCLTGYSVAFIWRRSPVRIPASPSVLTPFRNS